MRNFIVVLGIVVFMGAGFGCVEKYSLENDPPSAVISAPAASATVSQTQAITVWATAASGVSKVEFYIDDVLVSTDDASPYAYSWDTTAESNADHTIKVTVYENVTGLKASAQRTVTVENTIVINSPSGGAGVSGSVSITATDYVDADSVDFDLDDVLLSSHSGATPDWTSTAWVTTGETNGDVITITATATDASLDEYTTSIDVVVNNPDGTEDCPYAGGATFDLTGIWTLTVKTSQGNSTATVVIRQDEPCDGTTFSYGTYAADVLTYTDNNTISSGSEYALLGPWDRVEVMDGMWIETTAYTFDADADDDGVEDNPVTGTIAMDAYTTETGTTAHPLDAMVGDSTISLVRAN